MITNAQNKQIPYVINTSDIYQESTKAVTDAVLLYHLIPLTVDNQMQREMTLTIHSIRRLFAYAGRIPTGFAHYLKKDWNEMKTKYDLINVTFEGRSEYLSFCLSTPRQVYLDCVAVFYCIKNNE